MKNGEGDGTQVRRRNRKGSLLLPREDGRDAAPHLFSCWPSVVRAVRSAKHLALFLDFDGTLVPLRRRPGAVKPLDLSLRKLLRRLAGHQAFDVYVISGRPLRELRGLVRAPGVHLLGLHGWEGRKVPPLVDERRLLQVAKQRLRRRLAEIDPVWIEDKRLGLAVHYRGASPRAIRLAGSMVAEVLETLGPKIHMVQGHKVWELLPRQIDGKCPAVKAILSGLPLPSLPILVGDDKSDELAFRIIRRGLTIHVGKNHQTTARFRLQNPREVRVFLLQLESAVAGVPLSAEDAPGVGGKP